MELIINKNNSSCPNDQKLSPRKSIHSHRPSCPHLWPTGSVPSFLKTTSLKFPHEWTFLSINTYCMERVWALFSQWILHCVDLAIAFWFRLIAHCWKLLVFCSPHSACVFRALQTVHGGAALNAFPKYGVCSCNSAYDVVISLSIHYLAMLTCWHIFWKQTLCVYIYVCVCVCKCVFHYCVTRT